MRALLWLIILLIFILGNPRHRRRSLHQEYYATYTHPLCFWLHGLIAL